MPITDKQLADLTAWVTRRALNDPLHPVEYNRLLAALEELARYRELAAPFAGRGVD